ncbi:MAG TPA: aldose epimerase family protein [Polyangia bacterium]|jgi:aldose 1-epimerase|nr:aldose epimerase family protein [Polyangia bacterium]
MSAPTSSHRPHRARARSTTFLCGALAVALPLAAGVATAKTKKAAGPDAGAAHAATGQAKPVEKKKWGEVEGKEVDLYTLINKHGLIAKITNFGAILTELDVPDRKGKSGDVVLGWDTLPEYEKNDPHLGSTVGRVGNRIANAKFELDGKTYKLAANNGPHHLHGGVKGWDKAVWDATATETPDGPQVKLTLVSKDGDEGYPGTVHATTTYTLTNADELRIEMEATTDKPTPINMIHHSYWNLSAGPGDIKDEVLTLYADKYTPGLPPEGKVLPVAGTPWDFTKGKPIGQDLMKTGNQPAGYDENLIVNGDPHALRPVARVEDPKSGRVMTLEANQPGVQLYTANYMDGTTQGKGRKHTQHAAFCLETQKFPNSINVPAWKNDAVLRPGQTYKHVMVLKFSAK